MTVKKILVTGADGQLGTELRMLQPVPGIEFIFTSGADLDITEKKKVEEYFAEHNFTHCINCAAYTNVEKAEEEIELAFRVNAYGVENIALSCARHTVFLIHLSTDFVFDGRTDRPYKANDPVSPLNEYGASKLKGEQLAMAANPRTAIIRTSWLYNRTGKNFVNAILAKLKGDGEVRVVHDQFGSPTYAGDLAEAIIHIIQQPAFAPGIFHYCNEGVISWFQFAEAVRDISGLKKDIIPVSSAEFITKAKRPAYSALDCSRVVEEYGVEIKSWKESLIKSLT